MKKLNLTMKILFHITLIIYGLFAVAGPIMLGNKDIINSVLGIETQKGSGGDSGSSTYFDTKFENMSQVKQASLDVIEETMAEGAVLVKNESNALPLQKGDSVTLYGMASYYSVHTGQGSSGTEKDSALSDRVTFYQGLTNAGLSVNADLNTWYSQQDVTTWMGGSNFIGGASQESQYNVKDIAWESLPDSARTAAKAGIMVLARNSGEAIDMYMDTTMDDGSTRVIVNRDHNNDAGQSAGDSLALTDNEKSVLKGLKAMKTAKLIDRIVVIMNSASILQCDFLNDSAYDVDACLWVGTIGTNGADAVGKLLVGDYNPSGRTADTFWANSKYNPVYYNFGSMQYGNSGILKNYYATRKQNNNLYYAVYQEGIYNGYKYTETRYEDYVTGRANTGEFDYSAAVSYPFGFGLSYTDFTYSNMQVTENGDATYTVSVNVTNNTERAGKEVVQIYLQKPYTAKDVQNGVEKASVELIGFTKVEVAGNATVTATVTVEEKYFAAYDANVEKTYVIGSENTGDKYLLTAAKDAHDAVNNILQYKAVNGTTVDADKICSNAGRGTGEKDLVWGKYIAYDNTTYSTNEIIKSANENFTADYEGQLANYGVNSITNQFDDVDFTKVGLFSSTEADQTYMTRNNWLGTYGKRITLTATAALVTAQESPSLKQDSIEYPAYGEVGFYEENDEFDEIKLIYLRGKDFDDPLWDTLLDRMTWEETCKLLQTGLRFTNGVESIAAPSSSQQNGALAPVHARNYGQLPSQSGFRGFAEERDPDNKGQLPPVFVCNGIVAATYNTELIERVGEQTGEEAAWAGYNGIYGLGVNIHRGAYCGRTFEYYSEDGFLTGMASGYETVGLHKLGVFVLMKHAILNDQETHRAGINVWANEQSIREIYSRAIEIAVDIDRTYTENSVLGVMTGMNRIGATWTGGHGFCNTVLRAEYGMRGYVVSDYNSKRVYMSPIQGVLYGNDLPDGDPAGNSTFDLDGNDLRFESYATGYGELAWAMRSAAHNILYTVVNSNTMNGKTGDSVITVITPAWETAVPILTRAFMTLFIWCAVGYAVVWTVGLVKNSAKKSENNGETK